MDKLQALSGNVFIDEYITEFDAWFQQQQECLDDVDRTKYMDSIYFDYIKKLNKVCIQNDNGYAVYYKYYDSNLNMIVESPFGLTLKDDVKLDIPKNVIISAMVNGFIINIDKFKSSIVWDTFIEHSFTQGKDIYM